MIKHLEIKTYKYQDIKVSVEIDYDKKVISIVESTPISKNWQTKNYVFPGRGLEYMQGWRNVLEAIKYAIDEAEKELSTYIKEKQKEKEDLVTDVLMRDTKLVKSESQKKEE